ncbi:hypothetical protein ACJIZ3_021243 [Penstemon smallii]|uniref:Uncharacterized protein n=1 Tax=Penstemon smallii TaxID=265156 RepID=A0ABD3SKW5_9LAMI
MACSMIPFRPVAIRAGINIGEDRKPETRKGNISPKWWAPIFGFNSEPDYISPDANQIKPDLKPAKIRFEPGSFTEEKARQLRRMTTDASSFHDAMYHSAIASRLASDLPETDV